MLSMQEESPQAVAERQLRALKKKMRQAEGLRGKQVDALGGRGERREGTGGSTLRLLTHHTSLEARQNWVHHT